MCSQLSSQTVGDCCPYKGIFPLANSPSQIQIPLLAVTIQIQLAISLCFNGAAQIKFGCDANKLLMNSKLLKFEGGNSVFTHIDKQTDLTFAVLELLLRS